VAGAVVVEEVMALAGSPALTVCLQGVRDGLLIRETFKTGLAAWP
jgi:exopolyphosphatase/pppGpp-phosphohydrolase